MMLHRLHENLFPHIFFFLFTAITFSSTSQAATATKDIAEDFAQTIIQLTNPVTGIPPSHAGHPGFEHLTFLYDVCVNAMMLKMTGHQQEAERIMDYFATRLTLSPELIKAEVDSNNVLGVLKVLTPDAKTLGLVNAFDLSAQQDLGRGQLEFLTTPGPISFVIMAFLQVNREKYLPRAIQLGHAILSMQRPDGGIYDGDRSFGKVHTEPHLDSANALYQLYILTHDEDWKIAADKAVAWFKLNALRADLGQIYQGVWENGPSTVFATDVYSWTMAGIVGDLLPLDQLERITDTMLKKCLARITVELPGSKTETMVMADFSDSRDEEIRTKRGGFHPLGSPEWSGGVILALQKNAVRFWKMDERAKAREYKAMAEYLLNEVLKSSYRAHGMLMFSYATGQGIEVGHGWKTPYFYVQDPKHYIEGGSLVGGWPMMPMKGFNPFILNDPYWETYNKIDLINSDRTKAFKYIDNIVSTHQFKEPSVTRVIDKRTQIIEPSNFNNTAWKLFNQGKYQEAIYWATMVIKDSRWVELAKVEQRLKTQRVGGIIHYPWGRTYKNNESPLHLEIWKYPMLNEVATAMWLLASCNYELGNKEEATYWAKRIITEVPDHQIAHMIKNPDTGKNDLIDGYWNAITSWVNNPSNSARDQAFDKLLIDKGINATAPTVVLMGPSQFAQSFNN